MSTKKKNKSDKHHAVLPYITTPAIYVALSFILVIPMGLIMLNAAVSLVHKAQPSFAYSVSDIKLNKDAYKPSKATQGTVHRPSVKAGDKVAELTCENAGLSCDVFLGRNYVSFSEGAGMLSDVLPGDTGVTEVYANRATAFKSLKNVKKGDKIMLNTSWGNFVYSVSAVKVSATPPEETMPQSLLLVCASGDSVFSNYNDEKLFVLADIESGPQLEEVTQ